MRTETLFDTAHQFLKDRPSLAKEQLEDPIFSLDRLIEELLELRVELIAGDLKGVLDELTDSENFFACLEWIIMKQYAITDEDIIDTSNYKYNIRNAIKYPAHNYQNGVPPKQSLKADVNRWELAKIYQGSEWNQNAEYY